MSISWVEKYRPIKLSDVKGQETATKKLYDFVSNFNSKQAQKAALVYGEPGCGKTSSVAAVAKELGVELIEINASDVRNKEEIESKLGSVMNQQSLFFKTKLILMDEVDGVSATKDRGGLGALSKLIDKTNFPIVMTANNPWDSKFKDLRKKSLVIEFEPLANSEMISVLKNIGEKENISFEDNAITALARRNGSDMRGAINDFQTLSSTTKTLKIEDIDELGERKYTESMPEALVKVFKTIKPEIALNAFDNVVENQDDIFLWLDENIVKEYDKPKDIANAYEALSLADVYRRRIKRWQHWRFMVYINDLLTAGIAVAKEDKYKKFVKYTPTMRLLRIWQSNMKNAKRKEISKKIAEKTHSSSNEIIQSVIPYLKKIYEVNHPISKVLTNEFEFDNGEVDWLKKKE